MIVSVADIGDAGLKGCNLFAAGVGDPGYSILNTRDEPTSREEIRKALAPERSTRSRSVRNR
jgi:hypothetical protein